jgi:DNA modification methylase
MSRVTILIGDALERLRGLPDESVHACVTSPPYHGLRDYGHEGQIGLESSPQEYVATLVRVFSEVRRVLRPEGTLWLNLGDHYVSDVGENMRSVGRNTGFNARWHGTKRDGKQAAAQSADRARVATARAAPRTYGLKPKDLALIPHRTAIALCDDGWWVRADVVWSKIACMPESVEDRPTRSHESVFLLAKSERYHYDHKAVREQAVMRPQRRNVASPMDRGVPRPPGQRENSTVRAERDLGVDSPDGMRNLRDVWMLGPEPFSGGHFAVMPTRLAEVCIRASCPAGGVVLDPFGGAGTTGLVAARLQRDAILIELNPEYAALARDRIAADQPMFTTVDMVDALFSEGGA